MLNIDSSWVSVQFGRQYNWFWFSIEAKFCESTDNGISAIRDDKIVYLPEQRFLPPLRPR